MATPSASDARTHKRQAMYSASPAVVALDAAIWTSIIKFLPVRTDSAEEAVKEATATWQTLLNLRLVSQELAQLLHPRKSTALWQQIVLLTFDFTTSGRHWNIQNYQEYHNVRTPNATSKAADPQQLAMEGRWEGMPDNMLDEDFVLWDKLDIYHRPSQYGFLTTVQQDPPSGLWPLNEDPFSLFHDLLQLLQLPDGENMEGGGEGGEPVHKCLVAPASNSDPSSRFDRFHVMQTLGYAPHFWSSGRGIGKAWKGFTEPNAFAMAIKQQQKRQRRYGITDEDSFDDDDVYSFPSCSIGQAKQLFKCISQSYSDWRSVCCNSGCDGETPVFFVGKSKVRPHRWSGYGGAKTWT